MGQTIRFRGLRFPSPPPGLLPEGAAEALAAGKYQPSHAASALALARTDDIAAVWGAGVGHIAALLAGKLGLPRLTVFESVPDRRAYIAAIAAENGLPRMALAEAEPSALKALSPSFLAADLSDASPLPPLSALTRLRAAAILLAPEMPSNEIAALFANVADAGLVYLPGRSRGPALAFARPIA